TMSDRLHPRDGTLWLTRERRHPGCRNPSPGNDWTSPVVALGKHNPGRMPRADRKDIVMADRALRGSRLGAVSYETDRNHDLAPRRTVRFACPKGHEFDVPFSDDAELPANWECRL